MDAVLTFLIGYLTELRDEPSAIGRVEALGLLLGPPLTLALLYRYLVRRAFTRAIEENGTLAKENEAYRGTVADLRTRFADLETRLGARDPEAVLARLTRELRDENRDKAVGEAEAWVALSAPIENAARRTLAEAAAARPEDGPAGWEAMRLHGMGALAADPQDAEARALLKAAEARIAADAKAPATESEAEADAETEALRDALREAPDDIDALGRLAIREFLRGAYRLSEAIYERAAAAASRATGPETPKALILRREQVRAASWGGRLAHAGALAGPLGAPFLRVFGEDGHERLDWLLVDANRVASAGEHARAERALADLLPRLERAHGSGHHLTLSARYTLGALLLYKGRAAEAEDAADALLPEMRRAVGPDHHDSFATRRLLASAICARGRAAEAERLFDDLLRDAARARGAEHPMTLSAAMRRASAILDQGRADEAERALAELLPRARRISGADHPSTLQCRHTLALAILEQGRAAEAERALADVVADSARVLADHPDMLNLRRDHARAVGELGRAGEAAALLETLAADAPTVWPEAHPALGALALERGAAAAALGDRAAAEAFWAEAERVWGDRLTPEHPWRRRLAVLREAA